MVVVAHCRRPTSWIGFLTLWVRRSCKKYHASPCVSHSSLCHALAMSPAPQLVACHPNANASTENYHPSSQRSTCARVQSRPPINTYYASMHVCVSHTQSLQPTSLPAAAIDLRAGSHGCLQIPGLARVFTSYIPWSPAHHSLLCVLRGVYLLGTLTWLPSGL